MFKIFKILITLSFVTLSLAAEDYSSPLTIDAKDGGKYEFMVELAKTSKETSRGMMFRTKLGPDHGMLFLFHESERQQFWMKNTLISLDIIFIRENGQIANIVERAEPETETPRKSKGRAIAVLELAGGRAAELGIKRGDFVRHPLIGKLPRLAF